MTDDARPAWTWLLREGLFRSLSATHIVGVSHGWRFLTADTSKHWIEVTMSPKEKDRKIIIPAHLHGAFFELFEFAPDHAGLFRLTSEGQRAVLRLAEIDAFEKAFDRERREYERLKRKFEGGEREGS